VTQPHTTQQSRVHCMHGNKITQVKCH